MGSDQENVRSALQNLKDPDIGLVKVYCRPFRPYSPENTDAHEALDEKIYTFGKYNSEGNILLVH